MYIKWLQDKKRKKWQNDKTLQNVGDFTLGAEGGQSPMAGQIVMAAESNLQKDSESSNVQMEWFMPGASTSIGAVETEGKS